MHFQLHAFDLESDWTYTDSRALDLAPNSSTEIATGILRPREYQG